MTLRRMCDLRLRRVAATVVRERGGVRNLAADVGCATVDGRRRPASNEEARPASADAAYGAR
ncbi:hypothetical protein WS83_15860 [Burkholderia sp. MSMB2042]|uniref:Uncharacterized protein n=1 Tax=Burkholderia savannae TaxID=1637837 RepID=A0ABR5TCI8_9BURK|nr:hypothetical protein WS78_06710 [Burkholderia savannae]KVG46644.1 hypothetical protein WS77_30090 [Burkholderia sp. MSMB0265]KVG87319.1 hypothetical protein WS81_27165 [Burkholderia sp. MSMB2040]KVG99973.1 hypothetical protein WS82_23955 [Burkholderia sp. MSMB2041]KVH02382.1 hypothetical protein WS83_15860 [Burkholderia sp. MSMB2042]KVK89050.1 hypothetical protein WS91_28815 [Burkholderia sp. MSMB1498]